MQEMETTVVAKGRAVEADGDAAVEADGDAAVEADRDAAVEVDRAVAAEEVSARPASVSAPSVAGPPLTSWVCPAPRRIVLIAMCPWCVREPKCRGVVDRRLICRPHSKPSELVLSR